jgi:hypothetical protein
LDGIADMNLRKGDRVSIVGTVKHTPDPSERVFIELPDYHHDIWINQDAVKLVQADFEVGDKCTWDGFGDTPATVLAISDGHAWIDMGGGAYCTRLLTAIERVDDDQSI